MAKFELTTSLCLVNADAGRLKPTKVIIPKFGVNNVEGFFAALKAFLDKRQQKTVLLFRGAEESADVTMRAQFGASETNGTLLFRVKDVHGSPFSFGTIVLGDEYGK